MGSSPHEVVFLMFEKLKVVLVIQLYAVLLGEHVWHKKIEYLREKDTKTCINEQNTKMIYLAYLSEVLRYLFK